MSTLSLLVILDRQHGPKGSAAIDPGASSDLDGDGIVATHEQEASLTARYIAEAMKVLNKEAGIATEVLSVGRYSSRHDRVSILAKSVPCPVLYIACHCNAGGGSYALTGHDARSSGGKMAAASMSAALGRLKGVSRSKVVDLRPSDSERYKRNMMATISGIYSGPANLSGIIIEPGFLDSSAHAHLWKANGLRSIGGAIASACIEYRDKRNT